jgi:hypothetical protein
MPEPQDLGRRRRICRVALGATAAALLLVTACGDREPASTASRPTIDPVVIGSSSSPPAAVLPTKVQLGEQYLAIVGPFNSTVAEANLTLRAPSSPLASRKAAAGKIADANWAVTGKLRTLKDSIAPPPSGYLAANSTLYQDLSVAIDALIENSMALQANFTAMRDAKTVDAFNAAEAAVNDDGVAARRIRILLGLPDIPTT